MTEYFKTIRAYLRGKWGRKSDGVLMMGEYAGLTQSQAEQAMREQHLRTVSLGRSKSAHLTTEITRLRRNKKKHSHLQKQLDDLLNGGAQISDQQTETTK